MKHSFPAQIEAGTTVHISLQELEPMDLTFDHAVFKAVTRLPERHCCRDPKAWRTTPAEMASQLQPIPATLGYRLSHYVANF